MKHNAMLEQRAEAAHVSHVAHSAERLLHGHHTEKASHALLKELEHAKPGEFNKILKQMERDAVKSHDPKEIKQFEDLLKALEKDSKHNPKEHGLLNKELQKFEHELLGNHGHGHGTKPEHEIGKFIKHMIAVEEHHSRRFREKH